MRRILFSFLLVGFFFFLAFCLLPFDNFIYLFVCFSSFEIFRINVTCLTSSLKCLQRFFFFRFVFFVCFFVFWSFVFVFCCFFFFFFFVPFFFFFCFVLLFLPDIKLPYILCTFPSFFNTFRFIQFVFVQFIFFLTFFPLHTPFYFSSFPSNLFFLFRNSKLDFSVSELNSKSLDL